MVLEGRAPARALAASGQAREELLAGAARQHGTVVSGVSAWGDGPDIGLCVFRGYVGTVANCGCT